MPGVPPTRFVYLGPEGTFSEQALLTLPAAATSIRTPARSVPDALEAVRNAEADAAVVPLENSIGGQVGVTLDELANGAPLVITREVVLPVEFVLAGRAGTSLADIRAVAAHPQASAQCRHWLRANLPEASVVDMLSNAASAISVAIGEYEAAICAPIGASGHRLAVLADKIADHPEAVTRFALVSRPGRPPEPTGDDVTSLAVFISHDRVGALLAVLMELAVRGVNLTRIESYPTGEQLGRYVFFLDCSGHVAEARMGEALQGLRRICAEVRFLGSYPRAVSVHPTGRAAGTGDAEYIDSVAWLARIRAGDLS
jgi:prephenate dehydratase